MSGRVQGVGLRGCVERLLSADVRQDDLRELFTACANKMVEAPKCTKLPTSSLTPRGTRG